MKLSVFIVSALALLLAGCATIRVGPSETVALGKQTFTVPGVDGFDRTSITIPSPNSPNVFVMNNEITVDQEPLRPIANAQGLVLIAWALDKDSTYSFANDNAITLDPNLGSTPPKDGFNCRVIGAKKKMIVCAYSRTATARWKYIVRVKNDQVGVDPTPLDPWIHQQ